METPNPDSPAYRSLVLRGRLEAIGDVIRQVDDFAERIDERASDEVNLPNLTQIWRDLHTYLEQALAEVRADIKLLDKA